ncbi:MAG: phosphatase PAP2 family protein [Candidatus Abyssobacteria bacterium SURF_5]|uniref:Phosphatase PAP2 family protein n=1 Tax=Abyssobacteria bacterium (strain SURF_5) TaxID=2093360 RepID=A0A3A4NIC5_ABYX5|nr:MAG: phosphatase PAP2 family protein [Candidatus Abyssubacteria bacterium SURF_5]
MSLKGKNTLEQISRQIYVSDIINIVFVAFLLVVAVVFSDRVQNPKLLIMLYSAMLAAAFSLILFVRPESGSVLYFLRRWYPMAFVILAFFSLGWVVHYVLPYDIDSQLIEIDLLLFRVHPTVFLSQFMNPYAVDLLEICYASFYFLPVILGFALYRKRKMREFEMFAIIACLGFYLSDIGNLLFPARGPSQTLTAYHVIPLEGKWVGGFIRTLIYTLEPYRYDCFPSGHVAVTLLTVVLAYRFERRLFWWMLPISIGLVFSTVYLRYHYVIDIFAGAALSGVILTGAEAVQRVWPRVRQFKARSLFFQTSYADKDIS